MTETRANRQDIITNHELYRVQDRAALLPGIWACIITTDGVTVWEPVANLLERDSEGYILDPNDSQTVIHRIDVAS